MRLFGLLCSRLKSLVSNSLKNYDWIFDCNRGIPCPRDTAIDLQTAHIGQCDETV